MADDREEGMDGIRETDLNDDVISGAIGTNAITSIDLEEEDPRRFPGMDEMLKVATDLQDSGHSVQLNDSPATTPRLELENSGEEHITYLTAEALLLLFFSYRIIDLKVSLFFHKKFDTSLTRLAKRVLSSRQKRVVKGKIELKFLARWIKAYLSPFAYIQFVAL